MADKEVKINISSNTSKAEKSLGALQKKASKTFKAVINEAKKQNKDIENSFKKLGVVTEQSVKKANIAAMKAFETIKNSGVASANEIKRAHKAMTKQIEANNSRLETSSKRVNKVVAKQKGLFSGFTGVLSKVSFAAVGAVVSLTKFFDFLKSGAVFEQQLQAFENLAERQGANAKKVLKDLKDITKGTVSTANIIKAANIANLLGIPIQKMAELTEIARAASKVTGESIENQLSDIARGIGRQSRLILDNLGIIVSVTVANERFAEANGLVAKELTDAQRKTAFLIETLRQGEPIRSAFNTDLLTMADRLDRLKSGVQNFAIEASRSVGKVVLFLKSTNKILIELLTVPIGLFDAAIGKANDTVKATNSEFEQQNKFLDKIVNSIFKEAKALKDIFITNKDIVVEEKLRKIFQERANKKTLAAEAEILRQRKQQLALELESANIQQTINFERETASRKRLNAQEGFVKSLEDELELAEDSLSVKQRAARVTKESLKDAQEELGIINDALKDVNQILEEARKTNRQFGFTEEEKLVDNLNLGIDSARELESQFDEGKITVKQFTKGLKDSARASADIISKAKELELPQNLVSDAERFASEILGVLGGLKETGKQTVENRQLMAFVADEVANTAEAVRDKLIKSIDDALLETTKLKDKLAEDTEAVHTQKIKIERLADETSQQVGVDNRPQAGAKRRRSGGSIPGGFGGGDIVPTLTEPGEFILRKESVRALGEQNVRDLNKLGSLNQLNKSNFESGKTVNVNLELGGKEFNLKGNDNIVKKLVKEINNINIKKGRYENIY